MPREDYVRPPLVAREPGSDRASVWRLRLALFVMLAALVTGLVFVYFAVTGGGEANPGITPGG